MRACILIFVVLWGAFSFSGEKAFVYKNWKTFRSDYGYEFKYPDCWNLVQSYADEKGPITTKSKNFEVEEGGGCKRRSFVPDFANSVSFSSGEQKSGNDADILKGFKIRDYNGPIFIKRKEYASYRHFKIGSRDADTVVRVLTGDGKFSIRWETEVYCEEYIVRVSGPMMREPDKSYLENLERGDLALPEPEKTIYESIKCVAPSAKISDAKPTPQPEVDRFEIFAKPAPPHDGPRTNHNMLVIMAPMNVHFVVTDPVGRQMGYDPKKEIKYSAIIGSSYTVDGITPERVFTYTKDVAIGTYRVTVYALADGKYDLEFRGFDRNGTASEANLQSGTLKAGESITLTFSHSDEPTK